MPSSDASAPVVPDAIYAETVAALFARQPSRMVPDLERIQTLSELLGRPDQAYPSIHITGTNGKTSISALITKLLSALGLTAGTYTSPHLQDVRERIRIAGEPISQAAFVNALDELAPYLGEVDARHPERLTFFEVLTALAFSSFADAPVDVGVFEVGMGGTWDATNLVRGDVAVIGRVAKDHPELGSTPVEIAHEKAGIIKEGSVVVSATQLPEVADIIAARASDVGARLVVVGRDFGVDRSRAVGGQLLELRGVADHHSDVLLPLHGAHQAENAAVALAAVEAFLGFAGGLDTQVVQEAFAAVHVPGRLEVIPRLKQAPVLLDGAHNPAGIGAFAKAIVDEFGFRNRVVILGVLGDKDIDSMVGSVLGAADHLIITQPPSARAATTEQVAKIARAMGAVVEEAPDVQTALERATGVAGEEDVIAVTGSLYTVGAARDALGLDVA